jgi:hypothetical protein
MNVDQAGDQCTLGCNFDTKRPLRDIVTDYKAVLERVYSPTRLCEAAVTARRHARPIRSAPRPSGRR